MRTLPYVTRITCVLSTPNIWGKFDAIAHMLPKQWEPASSHERGEQPDPWGMLKHGRKGKNTRDGEE